MKSSRSAAIAARKWHRALSFTVYNTIQYDTIQYNTIRYDTIQYNAIQCNTFLHIPSIHVGTYKQLLGQTSIPTQNNHIINQVHLAPGH